MVELTQIELKKTSLPVDEAASRFIADGRRLAKEVNCFDFVPSNYENAWSTLDALPRGRFCEWGSGLGIVTGLAEMLGFEACGIEVDGELCRQSRELFKMHGLKGEIYHGSYFETEARADFYYVYCWPSIMAATETWFDQIASADSTLLICYGQDDIRGMRSSSQFDP